MYMIVYMHTCEHRYAWFFTEDAASLRPYLVNGDEVDHKQLLESLMCGLDEERDRQLQVRVATPNCSMAWGMHKFQTHPNGEKWEKWQGYIPVVPHLPMPAKWGSLDFNKGTTPFSADGDLGMQWATPGLEHHGQLRMLWALPGPEHMPKRMPERMSEKIAERMSDRMPERRSAKILVRMSDRMH